jgi:nucleotide-binding universal stress UspA family protein
MFNRILLAVDGTKSGDLAIDFATALAGKFDATVRVVHVNELVVGGRGVAYETESEAIDIVDRSIAALRGAGVEADGVHYLANAFAVAGRIAEAAHEWGADMIVFGSKRRSRWARFGGSGLRERVTALSGVPVLTAPAPLKLGTRVGHKDLDRAMSQASAAPAAR